MAVAQKISDHFGISLSEILEANEDDTKYDVDPKALALAKTIDQSPELYQTLHALQKRPEMVHVVQKLSLLTSEELILINQVLGRFYSVRTKK